VPLSDAGGASGSASLSNDTLVLVGTHTEHSQSGLYFQANNDLSPGIIGGDGLQCAGGQLTRLGGHLPAAAFRRSSSSWRVRPSIIEVAPRRRASARSRSVAAIASG